MNKTQKSSVSMYVTMGIFFLKFATSFTGFLQLIEEITGFSTAVNKLDEDIASQGLNISGLTTSKNLLIIKAIKLVVKSARKARVWAVKSQNETLMARFDITVSEFSHLSQTEVLNVLTAITSDLSANIASLTAVKVVAADITAITNAIEAASLSIGTPTQAIITKIVATQQVASDIEKCNSFLYLIDDLIIPEYEDSKPEMVAEYRQSRLLQTIGAHHTGLNATCLDAITKEILEGVLVTIVELSKSKLSDIDGIAEIEKMKPGKYHVLFTFKAYEDYSVIVDFHMGKIQEIGALMIKKAA